MSKQQQHECIEKLTRMRRTIDQSEAAFSMFSRFFPNKYAREFFKEVSTLFALLKRDTDTLKSNLEILFDDSGDNLAQDGECSGR
ncbi:MAG: hypothetical protein LBD10_04175 [Desulfobulbus sp.]|jgi:lauroyl/myristoyl acyltransferase|uniref:hypothetical protein n=1 Tax=Desulfobulbus sp. TaxID=895 RepID=UPI00284C8EB0|nr:hypothetical protein [Desulfobulbus sp.]MDR2549388.1 hypothetical protein [Desulfobulbus sp.]